MLTLRLVVCAAAAITLVSCAGGGREERDRTIVASTPGTTPTGRATPTATASPQLASIGGAPIDALAEGEPIEIGDMTWYVVAGRRGHAPGGLRRLEAAADGTTTVSPLYSVNDFANAGRATGFAGELFERVVVAVCTVPPCEFIGADEAAIADARTKIYVSTDEGANYAPVGVVEGIGGPVGFEDNEVLVRSTVIDEAGAWTYTLLPSGTPFEPPAGYPVPIGKSGSSLSWRSTDGTRVLARGGALRWEEPSGAGEIRDWVDEPSGERSAVLLHTADQRTYLGIVEVSGALERVFDVGRLDLRIGTWTEDRVLTANALIDGRHEPVFIDPEQGTVHEALADFPEDPAEVNANLFLGALRTGE